MTTDLYSGAIDWDRIYRTFHSPAHIATRVQEALGGSRQPVIFSGFKETAGHLAAQMPVTFVDYSPVIAEEAKAQYPQLHDVQVGDVTQRLACLPAPNIVIACRISAYWEAIDYFERLVKGVRAHTREHVLVDFFDRALVEAGQRFTFNAEENTGAWWCLSLEEQQENGLSVSHATFNVSYDLGDHRVSYQGSRCFYGKENVLQWFRSQLPEYEITLEAPLVENDPSFLLRLIHNA